MRIREAQRRLATRRRRVGILRSRVIAISVLCFALLWAVVFVQMATGNDPVIGAGRRPVGAKATPPDTRTDSEEAGGAGAQLAEAVETTSPEENEDEIEAVEPIEQEAAELEAIEQEAPNSKRSKPNRYRFPSKPPSRERGSAPQLRLFRRHRDRPRQGRRRRRRGGG